MRLLLVLRSSSDMCRSSTMAAPRADARDWLSIFSRASGELVRLILMELAGRVTSCATRPVAPNRARTASRVCRSLRIYIVDRHIARLGIYVASPHGTLCAHRVRHVLRTLIHQAERLVAGSHLNSVESRLH